MTIPQKFHAGGFLFNPHEGEILLHQRDGNTKFNPHKWAFFGGLNEGEESPKECFIREVKEELNVDLQPEEVILLTEYLNIELDTYKYVFYAHSTLKESEMTLGEGAGFSWVPISSLPDYDLTEKTEKDLKLFLESRDSEMR